MARVQTTRVYAEVERAVQAGFTAISAQGSSRSSKTYNILIWLIVYLLNHPNTRLSIVRKTLPAIKRTVFIDFKEILYKLGVFDEGALNKSELTYQFANGSWVEFFSTDSEQKLRGSKRDILYVNEANELSFIEWQQLAMRTTRFKIVDYNPSFSEEHWLCELNADPRTYHFISTYKDNPFLEQAVIDEIESLQHKNATLWQVYGLGVQAIVEGLVFPTFDLADTIPPHIKRRWLGIDFGFTHDPTAIVEVAVDGDTLYIDEKCYRTEMLSSDIIREFKADTRHLKVIAESADPRLVQEIYRAGINIHPVKKYAGSVEAGLAKMREYHIVITKNSLNLIKEFRNYTFAQDKEGKWLNQPIDAFNHAIDASRYVVMTELLGGERKPLDRSRIADIVY